MGFSANGLLPPRTQNLRIYSSRKLGLAEDGTPDHPVPGSRGVLLRQEDVDLVEFIELEVGNDESTDH